MNHNVPSSIIHRAIKCAYLAVVLLPLLSGISASYAEDVVLIKDINTNPRALATYSRCVAGSTQFYFADDGIRGVELWTGDALPGSTRLVKDIYSGISNSISGTQNNCVAIGNSILFGANDGSNGTELWISDGTTAGTRMLKDINPGSSGSSVGNMFLVGSRAIFVANDGTNGSELWISDGTETGTTLVKNINGTSDSSDVSSLTKVSDSLFFFTAETTSNGTELWKTDGTSDGTVLVSDILAGAGSSFPQDLTVLGNGVFFSAIQSATGREPWFSDGTGGGTTILGDLLSGASSGFYSTFGPLATVAGKVVFTARTSGTNYELFSSDGTPGGTGLLKDIESGATGSFPQYFTTLGAKIVFGARTAAQGEELYVTDGTTSGTSLLQELNVGSSDGVQLYGSEKTLDGSKLIFAGSIVENSASRVYATDGTSVSLLTDLFPGAPNVDSVSFLPAISIGVPIGLPQPADSFPGAGFFLTDGTESGTTVHPGSLSGYTEGSSPIPMAELNGKLILAANDGAHGMELWSSDGTDAGTVRLTDINVGIGSSILPLAGFAVINGKLLFVASDPTNGAELWSTDGTAGGTALLKDIESGTSSAFSNNGPAQRFYVVGTKVVFAATTSAEGRELWMSDGTTGGTTLISDIRSGTSSAIAENLIAAVSTSAAGSTLFFVANDGTHGNEVWATTTTITGITSDIVAGASGSNPSEITPIPSSGGGFFGVVFTACPSSTGCEVFLTVGGAPSAIDVYPGGTGSNPSGYTFTSASRMFFEASTAAAGRELMKSDTPFTAATLVKDVVSGTDDFEIQAITKLNSTTVLFSGCSGTSGSDCEPWRSDGTSSGTVQVKDINPGAGSSIYGYSGFGVLGGTAYFLAIESNDISSVRYFKTDGTSDGTVGLTSQGFQYFSTDGLPAPFTAAASTLLFPAYSTANGIELFAIGEDQCPSDSSKSSPGLCGCGTADADGDGDGAVDCNEGCPSDSTKQAPGSCGCGVSDIDANSNSVADCLDSLVSTVRPRKPRISYKGKRVIVRMTARDGVQYRIRYQTKAPGSRGRKSKTRRTTVETNVFRMKAPRSGSTFIARYRYLVPGTEIESLESRAGTKRRS